MQPLYQEWPLILTHYCALELKWFQSVSQAVTRYKPQNILDYFSAFTEVAENK